MSDSLLLHRVESIKIKPVETVDNSDTIYRMIEIRQEGGKSLSLTLFAESVELLDLKL